MILLCVLTFLTVTGNSTTTLPNGLDFPKNDVELMIDTVYDTACIVSKECKIACARVEIFGETRDRKVSPMFNLKKYIDLNTARTYGFEVVESFRRHMAQNEEVQAFYAKNQPKYDLQKEFFPLKRTTLKIAFYGDNEILCHKPHISEIFFKDGNFHYYMRDPGSDILNRIYKEDYASVQAFYNSQKQNPMVEISSDPEKPDEKNSFYPPFL